MHAVASVHESRQDCCWRAPKLNLWMHSGYSLCAAVRVLQLWVVVVETPGIKTPPLSAS